MALPPTVEKLWITVGISPFSVGKAGVLLSSFQGGGWLIVQPSGLSTERGGLPTHFPQV